jgi:hypothetical protein
LRPAGAVPRQIRWRTLVSGGRVHHSRDNLRYLKHFGQAVNDTELSILHPLRPTFGPRRHKAAVPQSGRGDDELNAEEAHDVTSTDCS